MPGRTRIILVLELLKLLGGERWALAAVRQGLGDGGGLRQRSGAAARRSPDRIRPPRRLGEEALRGAQLVKRVGFRGSVPRPVLAAAFTAARGPTYKRRDAYHAVFNKRTPLREAQRSPFFTPSKFGLGVEGRRLSALGGFHIESCWVRFLGLGGCPGTCLV